MKSKRMISLLLALVLVLSLAPTVLGTEELTAAVRNGEGKPGESVQVAVQITGNPGISGMSLTVDYNRNVLTLTGAENQKGGSFSPNLEKGILSWLLGRNTTDTGTFFTLTFSIAENAALGSYPVTLALTDSRADNVVNENAEAVPMRFVAGTVTVTSGSSGGDGGNTEPSPSPSASPEPTSEPIQEPEDTGKLEKTVEADDGSTTNTVFESSSDTVINADGSVTDTATEKTTETVTLEDGSVSTTETVTNSETTTNSVTNDDGSSTETVTSKETVKETVSAEDGSSAVTETVAESSVVTTNVTNADGSTTETAATENKETTTTTVTAEDGSVTTAVTETTHTKTMETTVTAEGKTSGTGTVSTTSTITAEDGSVTTTKTEGTVVLDTDDKGTVSEVTTAKTTTTAADGSVTESTTVTTSATTTEGSTGTLVKDEAGNILSAEATVSKEAVDNFLTTGEPINVPLNVNPAEDQESGVPVSLQLPFFEEEKLPAEIEIQYTGPGIVAYMRNPSGIWTIVKECYRGSLIVPVSGSCEIVIADNTKHFSDVDIENWFYDPVTFVTAREIFNGNGDGTFAPSTKMNRAMVAQILFNLYRNAKAGDGSVFSDVAKDAWYSDAVGWAAEKGIIMGADGAYRPTEAITRQDLVTVFYRYAKLTEYNVTIDKGTTLSAYADGSEVSSYAAEAMRWAISIGIVTGYEDGTLRPKDTASRAEVAAIMQRLIEYAAK